MSHPNRISGATTGAQTQIYKLFNWLAGWFGIWRAAAPWANKTNSYAIKVLGLLPSYQLNTIQWHWIRRFGTRYEPCRLQRSLANLANPNCSYKVQTVRHFVSWADLSAGNIHLFLTNAGNPPFPRHFISITNKQKNSGIFYQVLIPDQPYY